jgi:hypothetical protein
LANKLKIGNNDSNRSEKGLKSFGKLSTSNVTRVHGNVSTTRGIKGDLSLLNSEAGDSSLNSISDTLVLNGAHRQHGGEESVELIEATPRSGGSESLEDTSKTKIIHLIRAVENVNGFTHAGREILSGLSFTSSSGAGRCTTHFQMEGLSSSNINSIS